MTLRQKSAGWKGEFSYNKRCNVCTVIFVACKRFACHCQDNNNRQAYLVAKPEWKSTRNFARFRLNACVIACTLRTIYLRVRINYA